jgi:hypothetical protein
MVRTTKERLVEELRRYGEDAVADQVPKLSEAQLEEVDRVSDRYVVSGEDGTARGDSMLLDKALALATVQVVEGRPRKLARDRRKPRG